MRIYHGGLIFLAAVVLFASCSDVVLDDTTKTDEKDESLLAESVHVRFPSMGSGEQTFTLEDIPEHSDVYFVFTNPADSVVSGISVSSLDSSGTVLPTLQQSVYSGSEVLEPEYTYSTPEIIEENRRLLREVQENPQYAPLRSAVEGTVLTGHPTTVGEGFGFKDQHGNKVPVTLRANTGMISTPQGDRALRIWVADDSWHDGGTKTNLVNEEMVGIFRDRFLQSDGDNDIYEWVSNIFGPEWEPHSYSNLIGFTGYIDIVMFDINNDDSTDGGVLGYFFSRDNFLQSSQPNSNEMILFTLDSVMLATPDEGTEWSVNDYWPNIMVSALVHEFQHMIHFYHYLGKNGVNTTWMNELLSMGTEDIVADKIKADGPRGVAYDDYTAGSAENNRGRLPRFNYYNYDSLTVWQRGWPDVLRSYSINYAFGAFLMRNFGGPNILRAIYDSEYVDMEALQQAVQTVTGNNSVSVADIFRWWGASVLLSDVTDAPQFMRYNAGEKMKFGYAGTIYKLGSINLYNYIFDDQYDNQHVGPYLYSGDLTNIEMNMHSNLYYHAAADVTGGSFSWTVDIPNQVELTVVIK